MDSERPNSRREQPVPTGPARVFHCTVALEEVADGYRAMNEARGAQGSYRA